MKVNEKRSINFDFVEETVKDEKKGEITVIFASGRKEIYAGEEAKEIENVLEILHNSQNNIIEYNKKALEAISKERESFNIMDEVEKFTKSDMFKELVNITKQTKTQDTQAGKSTKRVKGKNFQTPTLPNDTAETTEKKEETNDPATDK